MKLYSANFNIQTDESTGETGFVPDRCPSFNTSWSALMLFHDVFEHWFEHQHKYFTGYSAENIGGEMCAMGALWYLHETFNITYRLPVNGLNSATENVIASTIYFFNEDNYTYGSQLISHVPRQKPSESGELEYIIKEIYDTIQAQTGEYATVPEDFKEGKKSATFRKIADLHRYGYNMAAKLFPYNNPNYQFFKDFWEYWKAFFYHNQDPEDYRGDKLKITINKSGGLLDWQAYWNGSRLPKNITPNIFEFKCEHELY